MRRSDLKGLGIKPDFQIDTTPGKGNARSAWRLLEGELESTLSPVERDVLDIAETVYLADRHIERDHGAGYVRDIGFAIPLREPERFDENSLVRLTRELATDRITYRLIRRSPRKDEEETEAGEAPVNRDVVCLISGGVDSFGGTIEACESGLKPILVSHYTSDSGPADAVGEAIRQQYGKDICQIMIGNLKVRGGTLKNLEVEKSMRLRSLLYLSLGAVTASHLDIKELWMSENGIMTPGVPFSPSRVGPYTTRTTHPVFVRRFSQWFSEVTGHRIEIKNPLAFSTKAEIVKSIDARDLSPPLKRTVSCSRRQYAVRRGSGHCGYCVPCIIRRTAFLVAGLAEFDDPKGYLEDCFDVEQLPQEGKVDMVDLTSFALDFRDLEPRDLVFRYVDLLSLGDLGEIKETVRTLKRFSKEVLFTLKKNLDSASQEVLGISLNQG